MTEQGSTPFIRTKLMPMCCQTGKKLSSRITISLNKPDASGLY